MGRSKVPMELISKEKNRKATYQNRKHGIIKKAKELSVLCDVNTAIILYPPDSNHPEMWPQNPDQIKKTIDSYKEKKNENGKRTSDLSDYFQDRKRKIEDELVRARERNMEAKYSTWFDELNGLSEGQLRQFAIGLENKQKIVKAHLQHKKSLMVNMQTPFGFGLQNSQPSNNYNYVDSYPTLDQVQALNDDLISNDFGWFDDAPNLQMSFEFGVENKQPANYSNVGLYPSFDQVDQAIDHDMMSHVPEWFDYAPNVQQAACGFELKNNQPANQYVGSYPSLDQVQMLNNVQMSQDLDAPTSSFIQPMPKMGGFGSPVFVGDVVYDDSKPWVSAGGARQSDAGGVGNARFTYEGVGEFVR